MKPRRDVPWWDACAFCPTYAEPDNGHNGSEANVFGPDDLTVTVLYGRRNPKLRRVHFRCIPLALVKGCSLPPLVAPVDVPLHLFNLEAACG